MRDAILSLLLLWVVVAGARGEPFDYRYTCDRFPEAEAWWRRTHDPNQELERGIDNGIFWLDTRASVSISDYYKFEDPALEPGPGEVLQVTWRVRTLEAYPEGESDVVLGLRERAGRYVKFFVGTHHVYEQGDGSTGYPEHVYPIQAGVYHDYLVATPDGQEYDLHVDGQFAFHGAFNGASGQTMPCVFFGDVILGRRSLSEWDFVRVQIVPEPGIGLLILLPTLILSRRQRISTRVPRLRKLPSTPVPVRVSRVC